MTREHVLSQIRAKVPHPATARDLARLLKVGRDERTAFKRCLTALVDDGALVRIRGNRYGLADRMDLVVGRLEGHGDRLGATRLLERSTKEPRHVRHSASLGREGDDGKPRTTQRR